ncbi:MAG: hypothetical protein FWH20_07140 [Oscillospiraceae bacterium]|nr:hypothetical protein [Oscillospiraceae bacterium]
MQKSRKSKRIMIISTIILICIIVINIINPVRMPNWFIRTYMLILTPIGTDMDRVIKIAEGHLLWKVNSIYERGYTHRNGRPDRGTTSKEENIIGVKSIEVYIGKYHMFFRRDVSVFYAFDEEGKLIDVAVLKEWDSI